MIRTFFLFSFCLFSSALWSKSITINGLLIEGGGYTGKTTVCQLLTERLKKQNIEYNHLILGNSSLEKSILKQASRSSNVFESAQLYAASFILDLVNFEATEDIFYLQDRSWLSILSMNQLFLQDPELFAYIHENRFAFRWNVLLTVDPEIKKERFLQREKRSIFNQYSQDHPEIQTEINQFILEQIPSDEEWLIIDTSYLSPNEIVEKIMDFVK